MWLRAVISFTVLGIVWSTIVATGAIHASPPAATELLAMLGLLSLSCRRRARWLAALGVALLAAACAASPRGSSLPPRVDARTVAGWVRGEPRRPIPSDARGASLGLQRLELGSHEPVLGELEPGSCGKELQSLLSIPGEPGVVLVSNAEGELFRYEDGARHPMVAHAGLPPIGALLGLEAEASPLHLLVSSLQGNELWELEIGGTEVLGATLLGEGLVIADRAAFLERYWVGRCLPGSRGCLALVRDDEQLSLDRRAHPRAEPEIVLSLGQAFVADVGYGDARGGWAYLLTSEVCEHDGETSRRGSGLED